jgi:hypothetical protein
MCPLLLFHYWSGVWSAYLECSAHAEDAVVGLLGRQTLESELHLGALFGDEVVGAVWKKDSRQKMCVFCFSIPISNPIPFRVYLRVLASISSQIRHLHDRDAKTYRRPNLRYPALSRYHSESGFIQRWSQGRLRMKGASEGVDMIARCEVEMWLVIQDAREREWSGGGRRRCRSQSGFG